MLGDITTATELYCLVHNKNVELQVKNVGYMYILWVVARGF